MKALDIFVVFLCSCANVLQASAFGDIPIIAADVTLKVESSTSKDLRIKVTIINTGNQDYKILKTPESPFSGSFETERFNIAPKNSKVIAPVFKGVKVKWDEEAAAASRDPTYVAILKKNGRLEVTQQLAPLYDFSKSTSGDYTATIAQYIELVDEGGRINVMKFKSQPSVGFQLSILPSYTSQTGQQILQDNEYSSTMQDFCNPNQRIEIQEAARLANGRAQIAFTRANVNQGAWGPLPQEWFGGWDNARVQTVKSILGRLRQDELRNYQYFCNCPKGDALTYAYVYPLVYRQVFLCPKFWAAAVDQGSDTRAGTIIHEASHFVDVAGGTGDVVYGKKNCRDLANDNPARAVRNADSYEYFAEAP